MMPLLELTGLADKKNDYPSALSGIQPVSFATTPDLGGEWSLSSVDMRQRMVLNDIWLDGRGLQNSGSFYIRIVEVSLAANGSDVRLMERVGVTESYS